MGKGKKKNMKSALWLCTQSGSESGDVVYIRYKDHTLFRDVAPSAYAKPFVRETLGWLDHEDDESIRLVWERFAEPTISGEAKQRASGLVILKNSIIELRRVG